ncbi:fungal hydrophobin [Leucogyrophana mollusca]|uniref:Fungal hydrophobin n=1 Tax=Leucogyrophana mollusca TaxID=85980 RepID=A0ACB8AWY8_9AGAM|nr:fungal hydrophobin [Leucogyrophana mollusca]
MFTRTFAVLAVAALAAAKPSRLARADNQCNTGSIQCCNNYQSSSQVQQAGIASILSVLVGDIGAGVASGCSPLTVVGTGSGANCNQEPVCCTDNKFNGLINVGCSPINLNL